MATTTIPQDDDVEQVLTRMMAQNSPLMKQARTQGQSQAQQAGLGQSTMGIKAAQAAAYNAAVPLASQSAQQAHQGQQQEKQFGHETGMQTRGFTHAATQAELDRVAQARNIEASAYFDRLKTHEVIGREQFFQANQAQAQRAMQERLASMEISSVDRGRALESLSQVNNSWNSALSQIAQNHELPADVRNHYTTVFSQTRDHQYNIIASLMRGGGVSW